MHAMRTGACTAFFTVLAAAASGEASGNTLPIASSTGSPSITPAPLRKVRRGIIQFLCISIFLWIKSVSERKTQSDVLHQRGGPILIFLQRLQPAIDNAFVEPVQFAAKGVTGHLARQMFHHLIF